MKCLYVLVELSVFAFRSLNSFSIEYRGTEVGETSRHQRIESLLSLRGRNGGTHDVIDQSTKQAPLFLTEENVDTYGYVIGKYLSTGGCLHSPNDPQIPQRNKHKSCAVVGASPNSHGSNAGAAIDSNDAVLRAGICDAEVLQNYSNDIGIKTTYCVSFSEKSGMEDGATWILPLNTWIFLRNVHPESSAANACPKNLYISHPLLVRKWESMVDEVVRQGNQPPSPLTAESGQDPVYSWRSRSNYLDPDCLAKGKGSSCPSILGFSSGFEAVLLARELCSSVNVYGFDTDESPDAAYGHLHDNVTTKAAPCVAGLHSHPFPLERYLLKYWHSQGIIRLAGATSRQTNAELGRHTSQNTFRKERAELQ